MASDSSSLAFVFLRRLHWSLTQMRMWCCWPKTTNQKSLQASACPTKEMRSLRRTSFSLKIAPLISAEFPATITVTPKSEGDNEKHKDRFVCVKQDMSCRVLHVFNAHLMIVFWVYLLVSSEYVQIIADKDEAFWCSEHQQMLRRATYT